MDSSFGSRLASLRAARHFTQEELSAASGISRGRIAVIEKTCGTLPHGTTIARLAKALGVKPNVLLGEVSERVLDPTPAPPPTAEAPAAFSGELLNKLLNQINTAAQQHRDELAALKKEHKTALNLNVRMMQLAANVMASKIFDMEGRLGMRPLTAAEISAQQALEPPRAPKIGLKHYDESAPVGRYSVATAA